MPIASFFPLIYKPTRVTTATATLIDNIFTNAHPSSIHSASIWITDICDHLPVCCQLRVKLDKPVSQHKPTFKRSITEESLNKFKDLLTLTNWNLEISNPDVNSLYDDFLNKFSYWYNLCFPLNKIKTRANSKKIFPG